MDAYDPTKPILSYDQATNTFTTTYPDGRTETSPGPTNIIPAAAPSSQAVTQGALNVTYGPGGGALLALPEQAPPPSDTQRQPRDAATQPYSRGDYAPRAPYSGSGYSDYDYGGGRLGGGYGQLGGGAGSLPGAGAGGGGLPGSTEADLTGYEPAHTVYPQTRAPQRSYHEPVGTLSSGGSYPGMPGGYPTPGSAGRGGKASGFSGNGNQDPRYQALLAKGQALRGKIEGMASNLRYGGGGASGASYGGSGASYGDTSSTDQPKDPRMRGFARGFDPEQAMGLAQEPTFLLPKLFPGLSGASPFYQEMAQLPAAQLAMLSRRGSDQGPSDFTNALADVYGDMGATGHLPSTTRLLRNLTNPGRGLERTFTGTPLGAAPKGSSESYTDPGYAYGMEPLTASESVYQFAPLLDAALIGLPQITAQAMGSQGYGGYLMDKYGSRMLRRKPEKTPYIGSFVGRRLLR